MSEDEYNDFEYDNNEEVSINGNNQKNNDIENENNDDKIYNYEDINLNNNNNNNIQNSIKNNKEKIDLLSDNENENDNKNNTNNNFLLYEEDEEKDLDNKNNVKITNNYEKDNISEKKNKNYKEIDENTFLTGTKMKQKNLNENKEEKEENEEEEEEEEEEERKVELKDAEVDATIKPIIKHEKKNNMNHLYDSLTQMSLKNRIKKLNIKNNKLLLSNDKNQFIIKDIPTAEKCFNNMKLKIDNILESNNENEKELEKENQKMLDIFFKLNKIVSIIQKHTKIERKKENKKIEIDTKKNNEKIINQYKKEFLQLNTRIKQLNDPNYYEQIEEEKDKILKDIEFYKKQNKELINKQKSQSILLSRQVKKINVDSLKIYKPNSEYYNLREIYKKLSNQKEKNQQKKKR